MKRPAGQRRIPKPVRLQQRSTEPFWMLPLSLLLSPAWRVLNLNARRVLDRIVIEHLTHGMQDNGKLPVTYDNFVEYGVYRHAIRPALNELKALGFIDITRKGSHGNAEFRQPTLYEVTLFSKKSELSGQQAVTATNGWRRYASMEHAKQRQMDARTPHPTSALKQSRPTSKPKPNVHGDLVRNNQRPQSRPTYNPERH